MKRIQKIFNLKDLPLGRQIFWAVLFVVLVAAICFLGQEIIAYRTVALLLLFSVSLNAMLFDILPVLLTAVLSAMIWNFFFIPPLYTFVIHETDDMLMFLLYFVIALVNAVMTIKIRQVEKKARDREEKAKAIKLYNTLLNSLSHELKTPIATIIGAVDHLQDYQGKLSLENEKELFQQISVAGIRLNRQVENLLNMSRLETGTLKPFLDWCDLNELVHSCIQKIGHNEGHAIDFEPDDQLPLFKIDRGLMEQVVYNLLHNAVQYTPSGTRIDVKITVAGAYLFILVSDNGGGIPPDTLPFLFDKFYRVPQTKAGGSGLGLSIVKGFVEALQGTIKVENQTPTGLRFTIQIPAAASDLKNAKHEYWRNFDHR